MLFSATLDHFSSDMAELDPRPSRSGFVPSFLIFHFVPFPLFPLSVHPHVLAWELFTDSFRETDEWQRHWHWDLSPVSITLQRTRGRYIQENVDAERGKPAAWKPEGLQTKATQKRYNPANTRPSPNSVSKLAHRRRRWCNIETALVNAFAGGPTLKQHWGMPRVCWEGQSVSHTICTKSISTLNQRLRHWSSTVPALGASFPEFLADCVWFDTVAKGCVASMAICYRRAGQIMAA